MINQNGQSVEVVNGMGYEVECTVFVPPSGHVHDGHVAVKLTNKTQKTCKL